MPTARMFNEGVHGITIYDGTPDQKITLSSNPYDWLEASFFYTNIQDKKYCQDLYDPVCRQDYKDKGFNFKLKIKEEDSWPAIAIGLNDIAGTGLYSSEYVVSSYGINNFDMHFGLGWGELNGGTNGIKNPLIYLSDSFESRGSFNKSGGQFEPSRYFSGKEISPFYGISYIANNNILLKVEKDTTSSNGTIPYKQASKKYSFGIDYKYKPNWVLGLSYERGNFISFKFNYKNDPLAVKKTYEYKKTLTNQNDDKYKKLIKNLENNGIGVNKILEGSRSIGLELTQYIHPDINLVEQIISTATLEAGIDKEIKKDIKIANLNSISEIDEKLINESKVVYKRKESRSFNQVTNLRFRPFLASREDFFKGALMLENDSEYVIRDDLFFSLNLKYSIADNFDDLTYPPKNTYPAQVRSDIKEYLKNINKGLLIGRAQIDYHVNIKKNNYMMYTAGILEDMFSGYGFEYLYFDNKNSYAIGMELFHVRKRDYDWGLGHFNYENFTGSINLYYRNYGRIPFDLKLSYGEYLAGDIGSTIEMSRSYENGMKFGIFASFTDVSSEQFGEGSFDKGIFFNIPVYGNFINYTWRPLTKDPGAKLNRKHNLFDLLVKFKPH